MQVFYCDFCSREQLVSVIWLHDGVWVNAEVPDEHMRAAEVTALTRTFPGFLPSEPTLRAVSLLPQYHDIVNRLSGHAPWPALFPDLPKKFGRLLTEKHPKPEFYHKMQNHNEEFKQERYLERVAKRPRV